MTQPETRSDTAPSTLDILAKFSVQQLSAREERSRYLNTLGALGEIANELHGKEVLISGRIDSIEFEKVWPNNPQSEVHDQPVQILWANIGTNDLPSYEAKAPYITITAMTLRTDVILTAHLAPGGVQIIPLPEEAA